MKCEICGMDVKNLGVHKYHKHRDILKPGEVIPMDHPNEIFVDEFTEKPLSDLISKFREILKAYRHELNVRVLEKGGKACEIEIRARIQV